MPPSLREDGMGSGETRKSRLVRGLAGGCFPRTGGRGLDVHLSKMRRSWRARIRFVPQKKRFIPRPTTLTIDHYCHGQNHGPAAGNVAAIEV